MCDDHSETRRRIPYAFLDDIKERFKIAYGGAARTSIAFAMNDEFGPVLQKQMAHFNGPGGDHLAHVNSKLEDVKNVMVQNIEMVLERGEKLELLVDKTDQLQTQAFQFNKSSRKLRNAMFWKRVKYCALVAFLILFVLWIISMIACGGPAYGSCRSDSDKRRLAWSYTITAIIAR
jgi:vesicle-associated membrane protein 7